MAENRDHFKPRESIFTPEDIVRYPVVAPPVIPREPIDWISVLWIAASWFAVVSNIFVAFIVIRDMYMTGYNPLTHWFFTSALVSTILGLALIHAKVIRK